MIFTNHFEVTMSNEFFFKDCSDLKWFLGMKFEFSDGIIESFIDNLLRKIGNERLQKCIDNSCRKTKFHEDVMFCKVKNSGNQDSSSEDPSVANTHFGYVNETTFANVPAAIMNE